ncbi:glycosyltransferase family 39 protein [Oscillospiraceae bacterium OttesenSCG-928-F05]|nr:glycosyltransferase family 39 protein [Oscillospiraceae bacterium OttesenSCG-928-F05]
MSLLDTFFFSFAFVAVALALVRRPVKAPWAGDRITSDSKVFWIFCGALFLVFAAVRVWRFGEVPGGMNQDGAMAAVDAYALSLYGTDRFGMWLPAHFTAWGYGQMSVLLSYVMVPFIKIFGLSAFSARLPMLLVSLAAGAVLFRFVWRVCGKSAAAVALFFLAINPWHIMQSRWALDCNLLPHMVLFGIFCLYLGLWRKGFLYLSMVFFGLAMFTYGIAWFAVPILLVMLCAYLLRTKLIKVREAALCAAVFLVTALPVILVMIVNFFGLESIETPLFTAAYFSDSVRASDLLFFSPEPLAQLWKNLGSFANCVLLQRGDPLWNAVPGFGTIYLFSMPFAVAGVFAVRHLLKALDPKRRAGLWFVLLWGVIGAIVGIFVNDVNINRINLIFYPLILLCALGLWFVLFVKTRKEAMAAMLAGVYLLSFGRFSASYFGETNTALSAQFMDGFGQAAAFIDERWDGPIYVTAYTQAPGYGHVTTILVQFHLALDPAYVRGETPKEGTALPYSERYQTTKFAAEGVDPGAVCIFNQYERGLFEGGGFTLYDFGGFGVAVPETIRLE